jgi:CHAT domain-containing protein/Flp pilus assembly protein TadD
VAHRSGEATILNNIAAQQQGSSPSDATEAEALKLTQEGFQLQKQGSKESLLAARKKYEAALVLWQKLEDKTGQIVTLLNIGRIYDDVGEKQKALQFYNQALPILRAVRNTGGEATALNNIGLIYDDLGEKQKALEFYNQALSLSSELKDRRREATTLNNIGSVYSDLGEKQKALQFYEQALPLRRAVGDKGGEAATLNNIGRIYSEYSGKKQEALQQFDQALSLYREVADRGGEALTLNNIGSVYDDLGEKQKALQSYNQALPLYRGVADRGGEVITLNNLAYLEHKQGNLQASLKYIQSAIAIIEDLRGTYTNQDLKTSYFSTVQDYYRGYINILMDLHKKNPSQGYDTIALHISERSRARGLIELLAQANAKLSKNVNPKFIAEEKELQLKRQDQEKNLAKLINQTPLPKDTIKQTETEIQNIINQQKQLKAKIRAQNPERDKITNPEPLKLPEIQQQLDKDTVLLQYSLGKERSYLWLVTPTSLTSYELPKGEEIEKIAKQFHKNLGHQTTGNLALSNAQKLTNIILKPVKDKITGKRLVIVADGVLQQIPFAALADPNNSKNSTSTQTSNECRDVICNVSRGGLIPEPIPNKPGTADTNYQPLMLNHEIVNLPSASTIAIQREKIAKRKIAPKKIAILADPVYSSNDQRVTGKEETIGPELREKIAKRKIAPKKIAILADPVYSSNDQRVTGKEETISPELDLERSALKRSAKSLNRTGWIRLPNTEIEAQEILKLFPSTDTLQAFNFDANYNLATSKNLNQYQILHFATHGFVNPDQPELSGIVLSLVNQDGKQIPGYLRLADLFEQDYPAELIVLSACETGLGKNVSGEGLVGLTRGLMYAGAARVALSLWQVDDKGTSVLMQEFYKQMLQENKTPSEALRAAQRKLWSNPDWRSPHYWAAFTLQGEWK